MINVFLTEVYDVDILRTFIDGTYTVFDKSSHLETISTIGDLSYVYISNQILHKHVRKLLKSKTIKSKQIFYFIYDNNPHIIAENLRDLSIEVDKDLSVTYITENKTCDHKDIYDKIIYFDYEFFDDQQ